MIVDHGDQRARRVQITRHQRYARTSAIYGSKSIVGLLLSVAEFDICVCGSRVCPLLRVFIIQEALRHSAPTTLLTVSPISSALAVLSA